MSALEVRQLFICMAACTHPDALTADCSTPLPFPRELFQKAGIEWSRQGAARAIAMFDLEWSGLGSCCQRQLGRKPSKQWRIAIFFCRLGLQESFTQQRSFRFAPWVAVHASSMSTRRASRSAGRNTSWRGLHHTCCQPSSAVRSLMRGSRSSLLHDA